MSDELAKWNRLTRWLMWITGVAAGVVLLFVFAPLFWQVQRMRLQISQLDAQIEQTRRSNDKLTTQIAALQQDPRAVEKAAREILGLAKPRETVYRFRDPAEESNKPEEAKPPSKNQ